MRQRGREPGRPAPGGGATARSRPNGKLQALNLDLSRLKEKYKEAHPEVQKVQVQLEQLRKAKARARPADRGRAPRRVPAAAAARAELRDAIEAQKGQAVAQSRKLTELESLKKQADSANEPLRRAPPEAQRDEHRGLDPEQQRPRCSTARIVPPLPVCPRRARSRSWACSSGSCWAAAYVLLRDYFGEHDQGRRRRRALPAPRPPGRGARAHQGERAPRDRGLPDAPHGPAVRAQGRPGPGGARDGHRPRRRQDDDAREPGQAARRLRREHGGASTATSGAPTSTSGWAWRASRG